MQGSSMELWLPYGETEIPVRIPDDNFHRIIEPKKPASTVELASLLKKEFQNPLGGLSLSEIVKPKAKAGIIVDPIVPYEARVEAIKIVNSHLLTLGVENPRVFIRNRLSNNGLPQVDGTR